MDLGLSGRRAAVAASSAGLGLATAAALAEAGCAVAMNGRDPDRLALAVEGVPGAVAVPGDVGTPDGATAFVETAVAELGGVDVLVTNAGGPPPGNFASTPFERYATAIDLNLLSVVAMCTAALPGMQERGWGRILAITSISVRQPIPSLILSNTARAGATGFLKTLALEAAGAGITVNSIQPGLHQTARLGSLGGDDLAALAATIPVGELGRADDFGRVAAFLCSEHARFITGAAIPVDGGSNSGLQ